MQLTILSLVLIGLSWQATSAVRIPVAIKLAFLEHEADTYVPKGTCPPVDGTYPELLPDSEDNTVFYICSNGIPIRMNCSEGTVFDEALKTCVRPRPGAIAPMGECPPIDGEYPVLLPDSSNKSIYYVCSAGRPIPMKCPPDLVFDPYLMVCSWPISVSAPMGECPETDPEVPVLLADGNVCSVYYVCFGGKPVMSVCPNGMLFNVEKQYCDFPANVNCGRQSSEE